MSEDTVTVRCPYCREKVRLYVDPDTADELLGMAMDFARQRYAMVNAAAIPVPNDVSDIADPGVE